MELKDYLRIISKAWATILGTAVVVTLLVGIWSVMQPIKYDAASTLVVNKANPVPQRGANYYQYDKYYSIQASSLYADTLAAWLSSPDTAKEIYVKAGLDVPDVNLKKLSKIFKPRRQPPVTLSVTVTDKDRQRAEKLVNAATSILTQKVEEQRRGDDPDQYFSLIAGTTVSAANKQDLLLNSIIGLIGGLILGFIIAFLKDYLRQPSSK